MSILQILALIAAACMALGYVLYVGVEVVFIALGAVAAAFAFIALLAYSFGWDMQW